MKKLLMIAALVAAPAALAELNYDYFDVTYGQTDFLGLDSKDTTLFVSNELADQVNFRFGYTNYDLFDTSGLMLGLGYNKPISDATDFVMTVDAVRLSNDFGEFPYFAFGLGVRSAVSDAVELEGGLVYGVASFGTNAGSDEFGVSVGGRFNLTEAFAFGLGYRSFDDLDTLSFTARFSF